MKQKVAEVGPAVQWPLLDGFVRLLAPLETLAKLCSTVGMAFFVVTAVLTCADVLLRHVFARPLSGTVELTELMMVIIVFSSVAYTQWRKNHIVMDIVTSRLGPNKRAILQGATTIWSLAILAVVLYTMAGYGMHTAKMTSILRLPFPPFIFAATAGVGLLWLSLLHDALALFGKIRKPWHGASLLMAVLPLLAGWWLTGRGSAGLPPVLAGGLGLLVLFVLFFLGMPVPFALMLVAFVFIAQIKGLLAASSLLGGAWYDSVASYSWAPLVFFMFMGYLCYYGGFGEDLYAAARACLGHRPGGLAIATVCACTLFGAVVGDVLTASVAMSAIALPEMRKAGYQDFLSAGTLACSGTIGCLIPPSAAFILYGVLSEQSVAALFMAGILPGLLCAACFILAIRLMVRLRPGLAPRLPRAGKPDMRRSFLAAAPVLGIFVFVIGGIYSGVFTPTEGGGVGATATLALALGMGRIRLKELKAALRESANFTAMTFTVIGGSMLIASLLAMSRIPFFLADSIAALNAPPLLILMLIILAMCVMGAFFPNIPLLLLCVPIFLPMAKMYQWDLVWFGVLMVLVFNMAAITPPFGISLFVLKGVAGLPLAAMYRAAMPFVLALFLCIALCVLFPGLSTMLAY